LPSGYCCSRDDECRGRQCALIAGSMRCADPCTSSAACAGGVVALSCVTTASDRRCEPTSPGACVPADTFVRGNKPTGACCTVTPGQKSGAECAGGLCTAFGGAANPFVCTQGCVAGACPANFRCLRDNLCAPMSEPYTCQ
jgi:hypothetical protein